MNESSHGVRGEESKCPEYEKDDGDCPQHGCLLLRNGADGKPRDLQLRRVPQHVRDGPRSEACYLSRIGAVLRGLVEHGQDQVAEWYGLGDLSSHVIAFLGCTSHLQQVPGHQLVGNEFSDLHRK